MIEAAVFQEKFFKYKAWILIGILIILYTVGLIGLSLEDYREDFLGLSFVNLLISFIILLLARYQHSLSFYVFVCFAFTIGMAAEWIGVHTGVLFGNYSYGESLGFKLFEVPLIIGVNWVMLTVMSTSIVAKLHLHWVLRACLSALLMLLLDIFIEPVAIVSDYWTWEGEIPLYNYMSWFIITLFLHLIYFGVNLAEKNKVATALYFIQLIFFIILIIRL